MTGRGFTLVEVLVATVLVAIGVVGSMAGVAAMQSASARAHDADLLQRMATEKIDDAIVNGGGDPSAYQTSGDFSDRGYPDATWTMDVETSGTTNVDEVTVTASRGKLTEAITQFVYVQPQTTTTTTTTTGATGAGGGAGF